MRKQDIAAIAQGAAPTLAPLAKRIAALEKALTPDTLFAAFAPTIDKLIQRIEALEARPTVSWEGVYETGKTYAEASLTTHKGGLWFATQETRTRPGDAGSAWRLVVKSGRAPQQ